MHSLHFMKKKVDYLKMKPICHSSWSQKLFAHMYLLSFNQAKKKKKKGFFKNSNTRRFNIIYRRSKNILQLQPQMSYNNSTA